MAEAIPAEEVLRVAEEPRREHDVAPRDLELRELLRQVRVGPAQQASTLRVEHGSTGAEGAAVMPTHGRWNVEV